MKCDLERKLKRSRVEVCLNCRKFVNCKDISMFEECADFGEIKSEAWMIKSLDEICKQGESFGD